MAEKRRFGRVRKLPSGRWQARYLGPDGIDRPAPHTFERKADADRWLHRTEEEILRDEWTDPEGARISLKEYAETWLRERTELRPKTRQLYEGLLRLHVLPTLGEWPIGDLRQPTIRTWRAELINGGLGAVTVAKAYRLLRTVLGTATEDRLIKHNLCRIKGAGSEASPERPTISVEEVFALADAMTPRYRTMILLATFCSLRWGELAALERRNVDVEAGVIHVRQTLNEMATGALLIGPPKSAAGRRVVAVPPGLIPVVVRHLRIFVKPEPTALVFAGPQGAAPRRSNFPEALAQGGGGGEPPGPPALSRLAAHGQHAHRAGRGHAGGPDGAHGTRRHAGRADLPAHDVRP